MTATGTLIAFLLLTIAVGLSEISLDPLGEYRSWLTIASLLMLACVFWSATWAWGALRSATNSLSRGQPLAKAIAVMAMNQLLAIGLSLHAGSVLQELLHTWYAHRVLGLTEVALRWEQPSRETDGRLLLSGELGKGSVRRVQNWLNSNPDVLLVELNLAKGLLPEVAGVASLIQERKLSTLVQGTCSGSCALVFLAGDKRFIGTKATIELQRAYVPIWSFAGVLTPADLMLVDALKHRDVSDELIDQVQQTRLWQSVVLNSGASVRSGVATGFWDQPLQANRPR